MPSPLRHAAVAGRFYPSDPDALLKDIKSYLAPKAATTLALGCIVPHAGYMYSGAVAGAVYFTVDLPQHFIVLCPNHTGKGRPLAIMSSGAWETPLGQAAIDSLLADA